MTTTQADILGRLKNISMLFGYFRMPPVIHEKVD